MVSPQDIHEIIVNIDSYFPLQEIQFFINDGLVDSKTAPISQGRITFPLTDTISTGPLAIKLIAYDSVKNKVVVEKMITISEH